MKPLNRMTLRANSQLVRLFIGVVALIAAPFAYAEPYLAVQTGYKCVQCHVNPTGGGLRNAYGNAFAQTQLAANQLDTGTEAWLGKLGDRVGFGGNLRAAGTVTSIPNSDQTRVFELNQARVYLDVDIVPKRLGVYIDEFVAPGAANNREAYVRYWTRNGEWYLKAGQMYLPFGFRLQDDNAFVRQLSGINMTTPDTGLELGWEHKEWSAELAISNGSGGGAETNTGKQY